jgi:hypothetical protein
MNDKSTSPRSADEVQNAHAAAVANVTRRLGELSWILFKQEAAAAETKRAIATCEEDLIALEKMTGLLVNQGAANVG